MSKFGYLDEAIICAVKSGKTTFTGIRLNSRVDNCARNVTRDKNNVFRAVDRRLQAMRKSGLLLYDRRAGWRVAEDEKERVTVAMYEAVASYVKAHGGNVVVASGVQIQEWPGEGEFRFTVGIKCTGRKPQFEKKP
jgi:hypothetical protein